MLLSKLIKLERHKLYKPSKFSFVNLFTWIYLPSLKSLCVVALFPAVFFALSHWFGSQPLSKESSQYQNIIAIHAGIGAIIFALVIFVAESMRDDEAKDRARVLLKESYLFPLTVTEILVFFIFIWGDINFWSIFAVIGVGLFAIGSLYKIIKVLLSNYRFFEKRTELLIERLQQSIDLAIDERIGNNILLSKLDGKMIKLEYNPFSYGDESRYYKFKADKVGIIEDINIDKLKEFAELIEKEANENGYAFEQIGKPKSSISEKQETQPQNVESFKRNRHRFLLKKFQDEITEESNTIISIEKEIIKNDKILRELDSLFRQAIIIKADNNFTEEIRYEISGVKDQFITAINNSQLGKITELSNLYKKLTEGFLSYIARYGGRYSLEQARKERGSLFSGWNEINWLRSDIQDLFEKAMRSEEKETILEVAYLPIAIARRAIDHKDQYIFQEFIWFSELLYIYGLKIKDKDLRNIMLDRSWRYLKEIADYYVEARLNKEDLNYDKLIILKDFAVYFYVVLQGLLKRSFDKRDLESFNNFQKTANNLFDQFEPSKKQQNAKDLKWRIERLPVNKEQKELLERQLQDQEQIERIESELQTRKHQMIFGLSSWILGELRNDKDNKGIREIYNSIQSIFPRQLEEFTNIFLKSHSFEVEGFWNWDRWELKDTGEVQTINFLEKLECFYVIRALTILESKNEVQIKGIQLPYSRDFVFLIEGSRDLMNILNDIIANPGNWKFILSDQAIGKADSLKQLLRIAKEKQENEEIEFRKTNPISQNKVKEFEDNVIKGFYETSVVRDIFKHYKLFKSKMKNKVQKKNRFGTSIVEDKAVFFEKWHVHYGDWGNNFGDNIAYGENSEIIETISRDCEEIEEEHYEELFTKFRDKKDIIIFATNVALYRFFENSQKYKPKWYQDIRQLNIKGFEGWYEYEDILIPVFEIYNRKTERQILVLNKSKLGQLIQFSPLDKGEPETLQKDIFYINVRAFSDNTEAMDEIIGKPPEWLKKVGDATKQREYLKEKVLIHIFERFEYCKAVNFQGYRLKLKE